MDQDKASPKDGSSPRGTQNEASVSQADGTASNAPRGETQAQPDKQLQSKTPEGREGRKPLSTPNDATTPKTESPGMPSNTTRDSAGEVGDPTGEGTLDAPKKPTGEKDEAAA